MVHPFMDYSVSGCFFFFNEHRFVTTDNGTVPKITIKREKSKCVAQCIEFATVCSVRANP